ncbi:Protein SIX6OS1 [Varanus komodoensis]|nr:Protein SIX6OS1 [Varanus komodoensis]
MATRRTSVTGDSCSAGNLHPISPYKDIGDLFGKMDNEDSFAFSFPSNSSAKVSQDDFRFPFAFGSAQSASPKGFQASSENRNSWSFTRASFVTREEKAQAVRGTQRVVAGSGFPPPLVRRHNALGQGPG